MVKFTTNSSNKEKNASLTKIVSPTSGKTIAWVNFADSFANTTMGKSPAEITAVEALNILEKIVARGIQFESTDLTEERPKVAVEDF